MTKRSLIAWLQEAQGWRRWGQKMRAEFIFSVIAVGVLWMLEVADALLAKAGGWRLDDLAVLPRSWKGLIGVPLAGLLHSGFGELASNTLPLLLLGWVVSLGGRSIFFRVSALSLISVTVGAWFFGAHGEPFLGASGLIYGYLGFVLLRGFLEPSAIWVVVAVIVGVLYAGVLGRFFPHLVSSNVCGFFGGVLASVWFFWVPRQNSRRDRLLATLRDRKK
jgi:membrane associated rhomboid family serine protease